MMYILYTFLYLFAGVVVGAILSRAATEIKRQEDPTYSLPRGAMAWLALFWPGWLFVLAVVQLFSFIGYCTQKLTEAAEKDDS
jgi:hypothetical protein